MSHTNKHVPLATPALNIPINHHHNNSTHLVEHINIINSNQTVAATSNLTHSSSNLSNLDPSPIFSLSLGNDSNVNIPKHQETHYHNHNNKMKSNSVEIQNHINGIQLNNSPLTGNDLNHDTLSKVNNSVVSSAHSNTPSDIETITNDSDSNSKTSHVSILPCILYLVSLKLHDFEIAATSIMRLLFEIGQLSSTDNSRFLSYTRTPDEISIICDSLSYAQFPQNLLRSSPGSWRCIQIFEGAEIIDLPGIVDSLCKPLAAANMEILYLSMFNSDCILVKQARLEEAFTTINNNLHFLIESRRKLSRTNSITEEEVFIMDTKQNNTANGESKVESKQNTIDITVNNETQGQTIDSSIISTSNGNHITHTTDRTYSSSTEKLNNDEIEMSLSRLSSELSIIMFDKSNLSHCTYAILHSLLYEPEMNSHSNNNNSNNGSLNHKFFSYTSYANDVSIVLDSTLVSLFPSKYIIKNNNQWQAIQVSQGSVQVSDQSALVSPVSAVLANNQISIFFLSTFNTDFTLVNQQEIDRALKCLAENLNALIEE